MGVKTDVKFTLWLLLLFLKIFSGFILGFTTAIIVQTLLKSGIFSVIFVTITMTLAFLKLVWNYKFMGLIVCNLVFISLFLLFQLYVSMSAA